MLARSPRSMARVGWFRSGFLLLLGGSRPLLPAQGAGMARVVRTGRRSDTSGRGQHRAAGPGAAFLQRLVPLLRSALSAWGATPGPRHSVDHGAVEDDASRRAEPRRADTSGAPAGRFHRPGVGSGVA